MSSSMVTEETNPSAKARGEAREEKEAAHVTVLYFSKLERTQQSQGELVLLVIHKAYFHGLFLRHLRTSEAGAAVSELSANTAQRENQL